MNTTEKNKILHSVSAVVELFKTKSFPITHNHEVNPGLPLDSLTNYIYFTLPVSINYQRSSPAMWQAALATYNDIDTRYLFDPHKVIKTEFNKLQSDLLSHKLALQPNKHVNTWLKLSHTFADNYPSGPQQLFEKYNWDVATIIPAIRKTEKSFFPNLGGAKLSYYWIYILNQFTDAKFKNLNLISIIPDTHVLQASIKLGLTTELDSPDQVTQKWFDLLEDSEFLPIDLHPVLWNWSRNNFLPSII
jgi:hypothetical protein